MKQWEVRDPIDGDDRQARRPAQAVDESRRVRGQLVQPGNQAGRAESGAERRDRVTLAPCLAGRLPLIRLVLMRTATLAGNPVGSLHATLQSLDLRFRYTLRLASLHIKTVLPQEELPISKVLTKDARTDGLV